MPAYVVFSVQTVHDEAAMARYRAAAGDLIPRQKVKVFAGPRVEMLEGESMDNTIILEFDTAEAARKWYYSPEYQELVAMRKAASTGVAYIVESLPSG